MNKRIKIAKIALLGVTAVMFLMAIGCGSSGTSAAGQNVSPPTRANVKAGGKKDSASFLATE
ncbi:MAG: hypothetical protein QOJ65_1707 [Fimbriimonadaceae bacterium]|jgi:hypothetical protein|nr:hypothetical protein [Fimbriimonadaceae bacterium]